MNGSEQLPVEPVARRDRRAACSRSRPPSPRRRTGCSNSRPSSMALVMSVTWNSSRQSSRTSSSTGLITAATGSALSALRLGRFAEPGDRRMHLVHELMEMHPALFRDRRRARRTGPSAGLAAPDLAHEIGALDGPGLLQQPAEEAARRLARAELGRDAVERPGRPLLQRVGAQRALLPPGRRAPS